jgi:hypothetical protein
MIDKSDFKITEAIYHRLHKNTSDSEVKFHKTGGVSHCHQVLVPQSKKRINVSESYQAY